MPHVISYEGRPRKLWQFTLEKKLFQGDLIVAFQCPQGAYKKAGEQPFSKACSERMRGNGLKLE